MANLPTRFSVGKRARLIKEGKTGIVIEILPEKQYRIHISEHEEPIVAEDDLESVSIRPKFVTATDFLRELLLFKLRRPLSDTLYSYAASRTNFEAYQFKPAVKFLNHPSNRLLLADEVGLGKTIEACIIYLELKARMRADLRRVLVVCPAGLVAKWQAELKARFSENFDILDRDSLRRFFREYENLGPLTYLKGICSLERLRNEDVASRMSEAGVQFDLVIVDEAHHMRNPETLSFDLGEILSARTDAMILLTATPVHLGSDDLFYLLNILEPGEFESVHLFQYQLEPNRFINRAISCLSRVVPDLKRAEDCLGQARTYLGENPYYQAACAIVERLSAAPAAGSNRADMVDAVRNLQKTNSFSYIFNRTRRREVTRGAMRVANVVSVELNQIENEIYHKALEFTALRFSQTAGTISTLGLIQVERQIASSLGAFRTVVDSFSDGRPQGLQMDESATEPDYPTEIPADEIAGLVAELSALYIKLGETDSKFDRFHEELTKILDLNPDSKVIVFSFFKRTLSYLRKRLGEYGLRVTLISGDVPVTKRQEAIERFKEDADRRVLLSSEVGAEGLDLQFCDTVVNYDLPWNPMRVEQRIGRVDRYGQTSDKVTVVSFFLAGTIEQRVLQRLYERIGIFEDSIGDLEPILGDIVWKLQTSVLSKRLSPDEEERKIEEFLLTLEHKKKDMEDFDNYRYELIGQDSLFAQEVDENISSGRYVSPHELAAMLSSYIREHCPGAVLGQVDAEKHIWVLAVHPSLRDQLNRYVSRQRNVGGSEFSDFLRKVNRALAPRTHYSSDIPLTFASRTALERPLLEFVNVQHPLTRMIFYHYSQFPPSPPSQRLIRFEAPVQEHKDSGDHYFFLFSVSTQAIYSAEELVPIVVDLDGAVNERVSASFLRTIQDHLSEESFHSGMPFDEDQMDRLLYRSLVHMALLKSERERVTSERNDALISARKGALEKTYEAKTSRARMRLEKVTDPRIRRMHEGEIRNLETRLQTQLEELEGRRVVSVTYEPVAYGLVRLYYAPETVAPKKL